MNTETTTWTVADATELYGIDTWGADYFAISDVGEVVINANHGTTSLSLLTVAEALRERGLDMPLLLRVENHLDKSISKLNQAFADAIQSAGYQGQYRGVFPIKVNQQSHIIEELARFGERYHHGLEAGSKAELLIALATLQDRESLIVCNGYKDEEFIDLGLQARRLGIACVFVIETPSELPLIIQRSQAMGVEPMLGVRLKLSTKVEGHWSEDSGDRSLFGLTSTQLISIVDGLKAADMLHALKLVHFHLGSQIPNIRNIRDGVQEACRYYIDLIEEGAPLGYLDLGGGLAVDYDGSRSTDGHSRNYSLEEYCVDIVEAVQQSLEPHQIPHPTIVTESGRATVAYTSVLLFNILDVNHFEPNSLPEQLPADAHPQLHNLAAIKQSLQRGHYQEAYNDALYYRDQVQESFRRGEISLRERSLGENLCLEILQQLKEVLPKLDRVPQEMEGLAEQLADIYYGNFSVFQSLPDAWAIKQVFPVMPIHRLSEQPKRAAIIADLTCDCDGKLDNFTTPDGESSTLTLHELKPDEEYFLGVFLVGAYQETLGDLHNLFGDTNVANVRVNSDGSFDVVHELHGDSIADVLTYVEYEPRELYRKFRDIAEQAVREERISVAERQLMLGAFSESLRGYTYFER